MALRHPGAEYALGPRINPVGILTLDMEWPARWVHQPLSASERIVSWTLWYSGGRAGHGYGTGPKGNACALSGIIRVGGSRGTDGTMSLITKRKSFPYFPQASVRPTIPGIKILPIRQQRCRF